MQFNVKEIGYAIIATILTSHFERDVIDAKIKPESKINIMLNIIVLLKFVTITIQPWIHHLIQISQTQLNLIKNNPNFQTIPLEIKYSNLNQLFQKQKDL